MICFKCGKDIENGAKFCTNCGAPMSAYDPVKMQGNVNYQYGQGQMQQPQQMMAKPKKKVNVGLIVALVATVVIFILGGTGFLMTRLSADEKTLVL